MLDFGIGSDEFIGAHLGKTPWLRKRAIGADFYTWSDLDRALYGWEPKDRQIRLFKNGPLPYEAFMEEYVDISERRTRILKDVLYAKMQDGASLVLNKLQLHCPLVHDLCMDVAHFVGDKTNANAYAAFGGEGSFGKHWDTHDVFALQLIGKKRWKIYAPSFEKPLSHQKSTHCKDQCPALPVIDTVLEAGDLLYLPRGWWHEVLPLEATPTFHVAIGTFPPMMVDYLTWLCSVRLPDHIEGRHALGAHRESTPTIRDAVAKLAELATDPAQAQAFLEIFAEQERVPTRFRLAELAGRYECANHVRAGRPRLNRQSPLPRNEGHVAVNGFKLNLDKKNRELIGLLASTRANSASGDAIDFSEDQIRMLEKLGDHDVIEWIDGQAIR